MSAAFANGRAWVVDGGVEVLEAEGDSFALTEGRDAFEGPDRRQPHVAGHGLDRTHGQAPGVQTRTVQVETGDAEPGRDGDGLCSRRE